MHPTSFTNPAEWKEILAQGGVAVMYHEIGNVPLRRLHDHRLFFPPAPFHEQLRELARIRVTTALAPVFPGPSPRQVILTFDDANVGVARHALPALQATASRAILFVPVDFIGRHTAWDEGSPHALRRIMDREQIRAWIKSGHALGSHSLSHPRLTTLDSSRAWLEISESKIRLENEFGVEVPAFAYPYGDFDARHLEMVERAGYRAGYTSRPGLLRDASNPYALPRIPARLPLRPGKNLLHSIITTRLADAIAPFTARDLCASR